jgi:PhnB protein
MHANSYLNFDGQCEDAFKFYVQICGGAIETMLTHEGAPSEAQTPPEWRKKILHARIKIGDTIIMGSDAPPGHYQKPGGGLLISLAVDNAADAERIFKAFAQGGEIRMPIGKTFFAERFGMVTDRFGVPWMVIHQGATA